MVRFSLSIKPGLKNQALNHIAELILALLAGTRKAGGLFE